MHKQVTIHGWYKSVPFKQYEEFGDANAAFETYLYEAERILKSIQERGVPDEKVTTCEIQTFKYQEAVTAAYNEVEFQNFS